MFLVIWLLSLVTSAFPHMLLEDHHISNIFISLLTQSYLMTSLTGIHLPQHHTGKRAMIDNGSKQMFWKSRNCFEFYFRG